MTASLLMLSSTQCCPNAPRLVRLLGIHHGAGQAILFRVNPSLCPTHCRTRRQIFRQWIFHQRTLKTSPRHPKDNFRSTKLSLMRPRLMKTRLKDQLHWDYFQRPRLRKSLALSSCTSVNMVLRSTPLKRSGCCQVWYAFSTSRAQHHLLTKYRPDNFSGSS